ncbi:MAG: SufS family cysteine desulfurase [Candidatus Veblenbacteria bacterium]|nr:SufS family cysteine desulfurase [Candidatus Veblenbacteria bacterium]
MALQPGSSLKEAFPVFAHHRELVFLDNAASCQKPVVVLEAMDKLYRTSYANVHRGVYQISEAATAQFEGARQDVARFINAASAEEVIFTRNATAALNVAAASLALGLKAGDEVLLTHLEHHANLVPWQEAAKRHQLVLKFIPVTEEGRLDLSSIDELINSRTKVLAITATSNVTGTVTELDKLIPKAKAVGATVVVDAAQAAQHLPLDVQALGCDLLAFSGHKVFGPSGIGVLWGRMELLSSLPPFEFGGNMIQEVSYESASFAPPPARFEAGTPPIAEAVGLGAAVKFIQQIGWGAICDYEEGLTRYALEKLVAVPGLRLIGPSTPEARAPVFSFVLEGVHPHDVASILDGVGVAVRAGHHCAMPLHKRFGLPATTRASFTIYNTEEDVNALVSGLAKARQMLAL